MTRLIHHSRDSIRRIEMRESHSWWRTPVPLGARAARCGAAPAAPRKVSRAAPPPSAPRYTAWADTSDLNIAVSA